MHLFSVLKFRVSYKIYDFFNSAIWYSTKINQYGRIDILPFSRYDSSQCVQMSFLEITLGIRFSMVCVRSSRMVHDKLPILSFQLSAWKNVGGGGNKSMRYKLLSGPVRRESDLFEQSSVDRTHACRNERIAGRSFRNTLRSLVSPEWLLT